MKDFFNIAEMGEGTPRVLSEGVTTTIYHGKEAMISIVKFEPHASGNLHHHEEEQWGYLIEGSATRIHGDEEVEIKKGDFWRIPSNTPHTMTAGPDGAIVFDVFAPPRKAYLKPGKGFGE